MAGLCPSVATEGWEQAVHIVSRMLAGSEAHYVFSSPPIAETSLSRNPIGDCTKSAKAFFSVSSKRVLSVLQLSG